MQLPWAAVSRGQQGKTKIKKIDFLCLIHFKLFSQIKGQSKNNCEFFKVSHIC
jgi:hypothetical protein